MSEGKRVEQLEHVGAVDLHLALTAGEIEVRAAATDVAEVTLEPVTPGDEVALDLIARTTVTKDGNSFAVRVPAPPGGVIGGVQSVVGNGNIVVGNIVGGISFVSGAVFVGGRRVVNQATVVSTGGLVRVTATVPGDSHVSAKTVSAPLTAYTDGGSEFAEVVFTSTSGDLNTVGARRVNAHSVSGDITADGAQWMLANSTSGDVRADSLAGNLDVRSISGDIRVHAKAPCHVRASSVSGDVTVTRANGVTVSVDAGSVSGRVRT